MGSERRSVFKHSALALQGQPRSFILAPIESAYTTSYRSSIVTLVLSCPLSEILQVSCWELPHPYSTRILGVFPLDQIADVVAPRSEDPKLIIRVINFELVQPISPRYRQTDGRMTYDSNTALALRASRGKNCKKQIHKLRNSVCFLVSVASTKCFHMLSFIFPVEIDKLQTEYLDDKIDNDWCDWLSL